MRTRLGGKAIRGLGQLEQLAIIDVNLTERINDKATKAERESWKRTLIEVLKNGRSTVHKVLKWKIVHVRWVACGEPGGCERQDIEVVEVEELEVCKDS